MEEEWIRDAQHGDEAAIARLVETYQRPVYAVCYRMLGNAMEAEDAAQDAMVRAITKLHTFDPTRPMRPWLLQLTANLCRDRLRRRKPVYSLDGMGEDGAWEWKAGTSVNPERYVEHDQEQQRVRELLDTLSPKDRAVVVLFYWEDLS
ncbi:MAG: sigma-70 family RNA polymerase sigma factor, partial [Anaerolineae bacterium]